MRSRSITVITLVIAIAVSISLTYLYLHYSQHRVSTHYSTTSLRETSSTVRFVEVRDFANRVVKVPIPVTKIVSEYGLTMPFVYFLGAGDKLVVAETWGPATQFYRIIDIGFREEVEASSGAKRRGNREAKAFACPSEVLDLLF